MTQRRFERRLRARTRKGMPVLLSMDLSYWGKRRLRLIPIWNRKAPRCTPRYDLV